MNHILTLKLDGGDRQFATKDLDFYNLVCELEGSGVNVMNLTAGSLEQGKVFSTVRAILAVLVNVQPAEAGKMLSQHLRNGGALDNIMEAFTDAMADAGFGTPQTAEETEEETEAPKAKRGRKSSK